MWRKTHVNRWGRIGCAESVSGWRLEATTPLGESLQRHVWLGVVCAAALVASSSPAIADERFAYQRTEMAVPIEVVLYAGDEAAATRGAEAVFACFRRLNGIFSDYDPQSELRRLSATAEGTPMRVCDDLWDLLLLGDAISRQSDGAFDLSIGPLVQVWRRARRQHELPPKSKIDEARKLVDYRQIQLNREDRSVRLGLPGMRLDAGGLAKGYAVGKSLEILAKMGLRSVMIHAGGDLGLGDPPPGKPGWRVGIGQLELNSPPLEYLCLSRCAVATSGDLWQYVTIDGRRYSHIVDPRTGVGLTDHSSVTIVTDDSAVGDGLGKAVAVLGYERGLAIVEGRPGAAALVLRAPKGQVERYESSRWKSLPRDSTPAPQPTSGYPVSPRP